ncbi:hypothetical protein PISL3812_06308 [Talaromyces islandicus]|uniref:Fe2OG dioxygenase domain-containing protein n=1 Tax=Talaromyces islandicus TaxID=28573 RepID=A0A0U1M1J9_TALIS|nr:hypothetical protein PISL3812_06308 [Talaromyces islandicus]
MGAEARRKRRRLFFESYAEIDAQKARITHEEETRKNNQTKTERDENDDESTDVKIARLISLYPRYDEAAVLDVLISYEGCVEAASAALDVGSDAAAQNPPPLLSTREPTTKSVPGIQTSLLSSFKSPSQSSPGWSKPLTKRGKTLYLYSPEDIASNTPCSIIHNFLPPEEANSLLTELLEDAKSFQPETFQLFDNEVQSHHTSCRYVSTDHEMMAEHGSEFVYNGVVRTDTRKISPQMNAVSEKVQKAVNQEIQKRIKTHYPEGKKLKYQSPKNWEPNAAIVNCYTGPQQNLGWHSDHLTYLGPRAVIGSLSLGVAREFRVRKVVPRDGEGENEEAREKSTKNRFSDKIANAQGQISIHLPHNSLLVMHAEMQEEWKHSVPTAQTISPHPIAGNRRINITYRSCRESLHPRNIPRCRCGVPAVLRCVQRKQGSHGRYMWMCYAGYSPGSKGCSYFQWAQFDDDGEPLWDKMGVKPYSHGKT